MGGKSETTVTENEYDPIMSQKLADIAERQQYIAEDQWSYYQAVFQPYETEMVRFNRSMMPMIENLTRATISEQIADLEKNIPLKDALRESQMKGIEAQDRSMQRSEELEMEYLKEAMKPEEERMKEARGIARADVESAFGQQEKELARSMSRFGLDPSSSQGRGTIESQSLAKAAALAGAESTASMAVKSETLGRLAQAQQLQKGLGFSQLGGVQSFQGGGQYSMGNYSMGNPLNQAAQFYSGAQAGIGSLANRVMSSTTTKTTQSDPMGMAMQLAGGIGGKVAGAYTGGMLGG